MKRVEKKMEQDNLNPPSPFPFSNILDCRAKYSFEAIHHLPATAQHYIYTARIVESGGDRNTLQSKLEFKLINNKKKQKE